MIVMFGWDPRHTSKKLHIESEEDHEYELEPRLSLGSRGGGTVVVKDGAGFKTTFGDYVRR